MEQPSRRMGEENRTTVGPKAKRSRLEAAHRLNRQSGCSRRLQRHITQKAPKPPFSLRGSVANGATAMSVRRE